MWQIFMQKNLNGYILKKITRSICVKVISVVLKIEPYILTLIGEAKLNSIKNREVGARLYGNGTVLAPDKLKLGKHVQVGKSYYFACHGGISIGDYSHLSRNVTIYSRNHDVNSGALPYDDKFIFKKVEIGRYVWIGMNVNILPGVKIGDGAVIGMGTTVAKDVGRGEVVVGSPYRAIGARNISCESKNLELRRFWGKNKLILDEDD
jgi:acetyltransferase-like isoleucine patch superfamily enzyme